MGEIDELIRGLTELGELGPKASWSGDYLLETSARLNASLMRTRASRWSRRDYDGLEAVLSEVAATGAGPGKGPKRTNFGRKSATRRSARAQRRRESRSRCFLRKSNADLAPELQEALQPALSVYEEMKTRGARLDFLDLLIQSPRSYSRQRGGPRGTAGAFHHYFIDEFQDTDPNPGRASRASLF